MHTYWIDIVGTCNLRCPSCPTGNFHRSEFLENPKPLGFMSLEKFGDILEKIAREQAGRARIELYNWGEPLLHPKAAEFITKVKSYPGFRCGISSNLSLKADLSAVVAARPDWFRISLSGFSSDTYGLTHKRGDVELVKSNMRKLREVMDQQAVATPIEVAYHVYRHNAGDDFEKMQHLCNELQFEFRPVWAQFYPLEKVIAYTRGQISDADRETVSYAHATCSECIADGYHSMMMYHGIDTPEAQANSLIAKNGAHFRLVAGKVTRDNKVGVEQ